ncbi:MAG: tail fiber domain-containing protein [Verrucomicrobiota bacterium]|nr:tail fiber domain-containing protein [Verrucomicrobiota bacterium]
MAILLAGAIDTMLAVTPPPLGGYPNNVTALGDGALSDDNPGSDNTGLGFEALKDTTSAGIFNTAVGSGSLGNNTTGYNNVGVGYQAALGNTTGTCNTAVGAGALGANTTGVLNVAVGERALLAHVHGGSNVAVGPGAMTLGINGNYNTAVGSTAMAFSNGSDNLALGAGAMNMANGSFNVALGSFAGLYFAGNTNIALGYQAGQNVTGKGGKNIEIGNQGLAADNGVIRLGTEGSQKTTFVAGIRNAPLAAGVAVGISADGQLGVRASSARFKEAIQPMDRASEVLLALQPVTFRYKKEIDPAALPQFGLVAEEVAKVDPDLVARDAAGKPFTVRYDEVNAMLLNEFLKEHRKVEAQDARIAQLEAALAKMEATVEKVSARLEAGATATRLVSAKE